MLVLTHTIGSVVCVGVAVERIVGRDARRAKMESEALIGSNLFPSVIRLADGRDVTLGDLVRRAATGFATRQWNLLPQGVRDVALIRTLDEWQRELTPNNQIQRT